MNMLTLQDLSWILEMPFENIPKLQGAIGISVNTLSEIMAMSEKSESTYGSTNGVCLDRSLYGKVKILHTKNDRLVYVH
jgi:hypothetical protein